MMKRNLLVATEFETVMYCYRSFSMNVLATPKNFILQRFMDTEFDMFRVINREDSDKLELRSNVHGSTYIDKKQIRDSFELNRNFVIHLINSDIKIVIPKPNFEWLFGTGREENKWTPTKSELGHTLLEFNDNFKSKFTVDKISYVQHPRIRHMDECYPLT
jgi:hypothetical protein